MGWGAQFSSSIICVPEFCVIFLTFLSLLLLETRSLFMFKHYINLLRMHTCTCACHGAHVEVGGQLSGAGFQDGLSHLDGTHRFHYTNWPLSSKDPLVSVPLALGL